MNCNNCVSTQQTEQSIVNNFKQFEPCTEFFEHPNGYFLPHKFTRKLHGAIFNRMYEIKPNATYFLKEICGKEYWKSLSKQERRVAHSCVDYLINHESLPLRLEECDGKKKYFFCRF